MSLSRITLRLRALLPSAAMAALCGAALCSCSENDGEEDEYANWKARNESYFRAAMRQDGDSITAARKSHGEAWENFCNRRQLLCFSRDNGGTHAQTDSVAVEIIRRGTGTRRPYSSDSVRIAYRTLLIPTAQHPAGLVADHSGFSSEYAKVFDRATMAPATFKVNALVKGVTTALLHMREGDRWRVTIPRQLAYGSSASGTVPANSTLVFEMELIGVYRSGVSPGTWQ